MIQISNKILRKNLDKENVLIDELKITTYSDSYLTLETIPEEFGLGDNLVKFKANNFSLVPNTIIVFECIDNNRNPVSLKVLKTKSNASRYISINIDDTISNGQGNLIVCFTARTYPNGVLIDSSLYKDRNFNVRYTYPIYINKNIETDSEIYFDTEPNIEVTEVIAPSIKSYPENIISVSKTGSLDYELSPINNIPYIFTNSEFEFTSEMIDSDIIISSIINQQPDVPSSYSETTTKIIDIKDKYTAILDKPITRRLKYRPVDDNIKKFTTNDFQINYKIFSSSIEMPKSQSYVKFESDDIKPGTGKIDKLNVYVNSSTSADYNYKLVSSLPILNSSLLYDSTINDLRNDIGLLSSQTKIDTYFEKEYIGTQSSNLNLIKYDKSNLFNSMYMYYSGSQPSGQIQSIKLKDTYKMNFKPGKYTLEFKLQGITDEINIGSPSIAILLSGSSFKNEQRNINNYDGYLIDEINQSEELRYYGKLKYDFNVINSGSGVIKFINKKGTFFISDITVKSSIVAGSNPTYTRQYIPIDLNSRYDDLDFKFEFVNKNGDVSPTTITKKVADYIGSNTYISGDDNQLYGKMMLSNDPGKGLIISGDREGGFIQSQNAETGSGINIFDFTSGSKYNYNYSGSNIDNNIGMDLFADNGDYITYRGYGTASGVFIESDSIPKIKPYVGVGVSQESAGSSPDVTSESQTLLNCDVYNLFELNYKSNKVINLIEVKPYSNYKFIMKNHSTSSININFVPSASYNVAENAVIQIQSGSFVTIDMFQTRFKRIWTKSNDLYYI